MFRIPVKALSSLLNILMACNKPFRKRLLNVSLRKRYVVSILKKLKPLRTENIKQMIDHMPGLIPSFTKTHNFVLVTPKYSQPELCH